MDLPIRQARLADLLALLALDRASAGAAHWPEAEYRNLIESQHTQAAVRPLLLVAEANAAPAGMIVARAVAGEWEIENVAVLPTYRRQGIAAALVQALLAAAAAAGASAVFLEVRESNQPARKLYERFGFRETGRRPAYYHQPEEAAILYQRGFGG